MSHARAFLKFLKERFGIPEPAFEGLQIVEVGDLWVATPEAAQFRSRYVKRRGIRLARVHKKGYKLTTAAMQLFGRYATRNRIELSEEDLPRFLRGEDLRLETVPEGVEPGQVIVTYRGDVIGSGLLQGNKLKNQIPKGRRIPL